MGKALIKDNLRRIWKTRGRFLAILAIIAIGCGFFAGVKVTSPDMKATADKYYKDQRLMDIHLISTLGFSHKEIEKLSADDDILGICGGYSADLYIRSEDGASPVAKVYSLDTSAGESSENYINRPELTEGRMPEAPDECVIEVKTPDNFQIGDTITLETQDKDNPVTDTLKYQTFKIVGRVSWVKYVDFERGTTTLGSGSISSYLMIPEEAFASDYYTDVYITLNSTKDMDSFTDEYTDRINEKKSELEGLAEDIHKERIEEIRAELESARSEAADGEDEYQDGVEKFNAEIADAETKLQNAQAEIDAKQQEIDDSIAQYSVSLAQYNSGVSEYNYGRSSLEQQRTSLSEARTQAEPAKQLYSSLESLIQSGAETQVKPEDDSFSTMLSSIAALDTEALSVSTVAAEYISLPADDPQKAADKEILSQSLAALAAQIADSDAQLEQAQYAVDSASAQLSYTRQQLDDTYRQLVEAKKAIDDGMAQLAQARTELTQNQKELEEKKAQGQQELDDAKAELENGNQELDNAEDDYKSIVDNLKWYVLDRDSNTGYSSFKEDADRVDSIAKVFPVFFIIIAAFVCLTTMTRMVEEQRTEIGTLKALGYGSGAILSQYIFYSALASIFGAVSGLLIGFQLFPKVISGAYKLMYNYPDVICSFRWDYAAGCIIASLLCTGLSSVIACRRELSVHPAQLMRPKPPKSGKRVLLERIKLIWNRLSFNSKVTARNVARYKNRVIMTVLGIGGCTALMLAGFGLRYAISVIVDLQFGEIMTYDELCTFSAEDGFEEDILQNEIAAMPEVSEYLFAAQKSVTVNAGDESREAFAVVPENPERIGSFITLRDRKTHEAFAPDDTGVIINEKLAKLLNVSAGDSLTFGESETEVTITAVTENYSGNYVYFTPAVYESVIGERENNIVYVNAAEGYSAEEASEKILTSKTVTSVNLMKFAGDTFKKIVRSLNAIVYVIIGSSGALAFVVLYNLSNISITERMRELATIKVLGFYDSEVAAYIYRENIISSFLGIIAGLFGGIFLTRFVVQTAEVDVVMFCPDIPLHCFLCAAALTAAFTALVNGLLYFKLKGIDMAGSMKAIE